MVGVIFASFRLGERGTFLELFHVQGVLLLLEQKFAGFFKSTLLSPAHLVPQLFLALQWFLLFNKVSQFLRLRA